MHKSTKSIKLVVGKIAAGKSSLLNKILGLKL